MTGTNEVNLSAAEWAVALEVCTPRQVQILGLRRRGVSQRTIALALGLSRSTVQSTQRSAVRKLMLAIGDAA